MHAYLYSLTSSKKCSICLISLKKEKDAVAHTGLKGKKHPFHQACIAKWLAASNTCPNCKIPVVNLRDQCSREIKLTVRNLLLGGTLGAINAWNAPGGRIWGGLLATTKLGFEVAGAATVAIESLSHLERNMKAIMTNQLGYREAVENVLMMAAVTALAREAVKISIDRLGRAETGNGLIAIGLTTLAIRAARAALGTVIEEKVGTVLAGAVGAALSDLLYRKIKIL